MKIGDIVRIDKSFIDRTKRNFNHMDKWIVEDFYDSLCGCNIMVIKNRKTCERVSLPEYDLIITERAENKIANKMKKGNKVRLLKDNSIGTITDITFFKTNGQKHVRFLVKKRGEKEGRWFPEEDLGSVIEHCKITSEGENGQVIYANVDFNHERSEATIHITADNPQNLRISHEGITIHVRRNER